MKKHLLPLLAIMLASPMAASALEVQHQGDVSYVSGGIGSEEREALKAMERDFNLKIMMASKEGPYISGTPITIFDAAGQQVLAAVSDGPFLYAKLPGGKYTIKAGTEPATQSAGVTLHDGDLQNLRFYW